MDQRIIREYTRLRGMGWRAVDAYRAASVYARFVAAGPLVDLLVEVDVDEYQIGDLEDENEVRARVSREGTFGIIARYRPSEDDSWRAVDSCWGFIGDDWKDSGYDTDLMLAALEALDEAIGDEASLIAKRATFAGVQS